MIHPLDPKETVFKTLKDGKTMFELHFGFTSEDRTKVYTYERVLARGCSMRCNLLWNNYKV